MSNIRLLRDYAGRRTNEQRILPGVYAADDPALFGQAEYLVENGHAVFTDEPPVKSVVMDTVTAVQVVSIDGRDVKVLPHDAPPEMVQEHYPQTVKQTDEPGEPKSLEESWTLKDMQAFAGEFGIDLGNSTRKSDIAPIIEAWCDEMVFNESDLANWYLSRHADE